MAIEKIKDSKYNSLLFLMYECPYIDHSVISTLFKASYQASCTLTKRGFIEAFDGLRFGLSARKCYKLTDAGIDYVKVLIANEGINRRSSADECFSEGVLFPCYVPTLQKGLQRGGRTHFRSMHLILLWLQLRWFKPQNMSLLWDNVRSPEVYPLVGNPDLIFFDGIDFARSEFSDLTMVELEITEKSAHGIYERIQTLSKNRHVMILIVSPDKELLKNYVLGVRKALPQSNYFNGVRSFGLQVTRDEAYLHRIWFLEWDPTLHRIQDGEIGQTAAKRIDHPDFDAMGEWKFRHDGSKFQELVPHVRWDNGYERPLIEILEALR
jgi:hypothetical protein